MSAFGNLSGLGLPSREHTAIAEDVYAGFNSRANRYGRHAEQKNCAAMLTMLTEMAEAAGEYYGHTYGNNHTHAEQIGERLEDARNNFARACIRK